MREKTGLAMTVARMCIEVGPGVGGGRNVYEKLGSRNESGHHARPAVVVVQVWAKNGSGDGGGQDAHSRSGLAMAVVKMYV